MEKQKAFGIQTHSLIFVGYEVKHLLPLFKDSYSCFWVEDGSRIGDFYQEWKKEGGEKIGIVSSPVDMEMDEWKAFRLGLAEDEAKLILVLSNSLRKDVKTLKGIYPCAEFVLDNEDELYLSVSIKEKITGRINSQEYFKSGRRIHPVKRLFDIVVSGTALILLSPLLLLIAILIKIESRGPIFYISKRIGMNYQIFDFYKFRSMRVDADKMLDQIKDKNAYATEEPALDEHMEDFFNGVELISDEGLIDEGAHEFLEENNSSSFVKVVNDPRITRVGKVIRNSSLDELPQLFNVLKGDMSLVGNRPLPLYEAEKLTSDEWVERFMAPAGITGLWQVTERGKAGVSEDGRMKLDITYARKYSLWMDMKILLKTLPAMFQQENV